MKVEDLTRKWDAAPSSDALFQRIDDIHILDIYVGRDSELRRELMIISDMEPARINSSKSLEILKGKRKDDRWATRIKLLKNDEAEVFTHLCWDLIEQSRKASSKSQALEIFIGRFMKWQKLMESGSDLLSEEVIRGIIGENLFMKNVMHKNMNWVDIISAWLGPEGCDQDFILNDTWVEVKTIRQGKSYVTISSVEQLDIDKPGTLAVVLLDNTSPSDEQGFSFADIINEMRHKLHSSPDALFQYESKLMELGYSEHREYHEKYFVLKNIKIFKVANNFPRLRRAFLPEAIIKANYDIALAEIKSYEVEG